MLVKIHKSYRDVIAVCDSGLIGKRFEEGKMQLELKESFFSGKEYNEKNLKLFLEDMAKEDATFDIVGKDSCQCALKAGIISKQGIRKIQGVPFALVLA